MHSNFDKINRILAEWNPIGVNEAMALDEYRRYVPRLLSAIENKDVLMKCLENILINHLDVGYNPENKEHVEDLRSICERIYQTRKDC